MPRMTVYIRNEDLEKWRALKNKSMSIHYALNSVWVGEKFIDRVLDAAEKDAQLAKDLFAPDGSSDALPCCGNVRPCRHWIWNGVNGTWINELTGAVREVI